jgi:PKD repeat protein
MFPFTTSSDGFVITNYDARPALNSHMTVPFGIASKDSGCVKIIAMLSSDDVWIPEAGYVWIENVATGERFSLLDTVKLEVSPNINFSTAYLIHIGPQITNTATHEVCYGMNNGTLHVQGPNYPGFTHELTLNGNALYTSVVAGTDTTITNLAPGNYVSVIRINGVPVDSSDITINEATQLIADFISDYNVVLAGDAVNFTDYSSGATSYTWDFGDGDSSNTAGNETHLFTTPGVFNVTLLVADSNGCTSSTFDVIQVDFPPMSNNSSIQFTGDPASFNTSSGPVTSAAQNNRNATVTASNARLTVSLPEVAATASVTILSMNGTLIANQQQNDATASYELPAAGAYIVNITYTNGTATSTTVLAQ